MLTRSCNHRSSHIALSSRVPTSRSCHSSDHPELRCRSNCNNLTNLPLIVTLTVFPLFASLLRTPSSIGLTRRLFLYPFAVFNASYFLRPVKLHDMSYQYPPSPTFGLPLSPKSFSVLPENPRAPLYDPHSNPPTTPKQTPTYSAPGLTVTPPTRVDTLYHRHHVDDMPTPERESLKSSPRGTGGPSTIPSWKTSDTSHMSKPQSRTSFSMPSESNTGHGPGRGMPLAVRRRQSRYDPMGRDDEDEDGYEDLGQRHPLRRVAEEDCKEESLTLPGIKALFGVAGGESRDGIQAMKQLTCRTHFNSPCDRISIRFAFSSIACA